MMHAILMTVAFTLVGCGGDDVRANREKNYGGDPNDPKSGAYKQHRLQEARIAVEDEANRPCDEAATRRRQAWGHKKSKEWSHDGDRPRSPEDVGYRIEGRCSDALRGRMLSCEKSEVLGIEGDSPYLTAAAKLGVKKYICDEIDGMRSKRVVEFPIGVVLGTER
jgi:hypothetical protein